MNKVRETMEDNFTPEAIALMIAKLQGATCEHTEAHEQVEWFVREMIKAVGGHTAVNALFEEIGV